MTHVRVCPEDGDNPARVKPLQGYARIFIDNSDVQYNQWIWNGAATNLTIVPNGNVGSGSIISSYTGADLCEDGFPFVVPFSGNSDFTFDDPDLQWIADYNYEVRRRNSGSGSSAVASGNIKDLLDIEALMQIGDYEDALIDLASFTPANDIEENYKSVLLVFATLGDEGGRTTSDTEKGTLMSVAEQTTRTGGPAVTLARGYLEAKYYLHYSDPRPLEDAEINGTTNLTSPCSTEPVANTELSFMDDDGNDLAIAGCYINADGSFIFDPQEIAYLAAANPNTEYRIFSKPGSRYTIVNFEYQKLSTWLSASPLVIDLAGVSVVTDTTDETELVEIESDTMLTRGEGIVYEVGSVETVFGTDMLITKSDGSGIIWTRTWHGPVRESEDEATCLYLDESQNVYVAGRVYNGEDYDVQILKYDTDGNLIWTAMFAEGERLDDLPTGIRMSYEDGVEITGTCGSNYRYIQVSECLPISERRGNFDTTATTGTVQPAFYPNPNNGSLQVDLQGQSAGTLELINVAGQVVLTQFVSENREIQLPANVENGVYLLKFTGEGEPYYQKLMIYRNQ